MGALSGDTAAESSYNLQYGIKADADVTLKGSGTLTVYDTTAGVQAANLTVAMENGTLCVTEFGKADGCCLKAAAGSLSINAGTLKLFSQNSCCLYGSKAITLCGGSITAQSAGARTVFSLTPGFGTGVQGKGTVNGTDTQALAQCRLLSLQIVPLPAPTTGDTAHAPACVLALCLCAAGLCALFIAGRRLRTGHHE